MTAAPPIVDTLYIFGCDSARPWNPSQWTSVDDRVRGGQSVSHLDITGPEAHALFHGHLDIQTLGGAGFASQRTVPELFGPGLDLSDYGSLAVDVVEPPASDRKTYTLVLKDTEALPNRPDGREQSTVSWEHDFDSGGGGGRAVLRLADFRPTYRGRPKPDAEPLDPRTIRAVSFMMRSHFGEQEGDFALAIRSVAACRHGDESGPATARQSNRSQDIVEGDLGTAAASESGWLAWLGAVFGGRG